MALILSEVQALRGALIDKTVHILVIGGHQAPTSARVFFVGDHAVTLQAGDAFIVFPLAWVVIEDNTIVIQA